MKKARRIRPSDPATWDVLIAEEPRFTGPIAAALYRARMAPEFEAWERERQEKAAAFRAWREKRKLVLSEAQKRAYREGRR